MSFDASLRLPFSMQVIGPSGSGKTSWCRLLLLDSHRLFNPRVPANRVLFYQEWQDIYDVMLKEGLITKTIKGLPELSELKRMAPPYKSTSGSLYIIDDAYFDINETVTALFTQVGHHHNISVIFISQRLFHENPNMKAISLNSHYLTLFPIRRDLRQITTLANQISPYKPSAILEAYQAAIVRNFGYLFCDFHQKQSPALMLRGNIFSEQAPMDVWIPRTQR